MVLEPIHSIFVQVYNLLPFSFDISLVKGCKKHDVGKEETDSLDKCVTYNKSRVEVPVSDWHS